MASSVPKFVGNSSAQAHTGASVLSRGSNIGIAKPCPIAALMPHCIGTLCAFKQLGVGWGAEGTLYMHRGP